MSDKRKREIRELMAETGLPYTLAAREVARLRRTGRPLKDAFPDHMAQLNIPAIKGIQGQIGQIRPPFSEAIQGQIAQLQEQMAQLNAPAFKGIQEQIGQISFPLIKGLQEQQEHMARLAEQLAANAQQVRRSLTSVGGVDEIERRYKAVRWFRALGHSIDDRPSGLDADTGRPRWACQRCGSDLQLDGSAGWASSTGTGRCPHEGASW
jgi:hypothetical protein